MLGDQLRIVLGFGDDDDRYISNSPKKRDHDHSSHLSPEDAKSNADFEATNVGPHRSPRQENLLPVPFRHLKRRFDVKNAFFWEFE